MIIRHEVLLNCELNFFCASIKPLEVNTVFVLHSSPCRFQANTQER